MQEEIIEEVSSSGEPKFEKMENGRKVDSPESGKSVPVRTDFSIESLLRKEPAEIDGNQDGAAGISYAGEDEHGLRLRLAPFCHGDGSQEIGGEFGSDQESSPSPEPLRGHIAGSTGDPRYFGITEEELTAFPWLSCTRFKPPKLPRTRKRVGCKRYGRGPRIPFAPHQIAVLESTFSKSQYLSSDCIHSLADTLRLSETRVKIWFQNRRARYRREREATSSGLGHDNNGDQAAHFHAHYLAQQHQLSYSPASSAGLTPADLGSAGQPLDLCRSLDKKSFEHFMAGSRASPESSGSEKEKLIFPDLIAQQLQRYREVQEYILQQEQRHLNFLKADAESTANHQQHPASRYPVSILQSVLQASPQMVQFQPFQHTKTYYSPSTTSDAAEIAVGGDSRSSSSSHTQSMQFESTYSPPTPNPTQLQNFSLQFR